MKTYKKPSAYSEKLKDPRWQRMRLEILNRDEWTCQKCFDSESTLHVHHRYYIKGHEPWEYDNRVLLTLCAECHAAESSLMPIQTTCLTEQVKRYFLAEDIASLNIGFHCLEMVHVPEVVASAIGWALSDQEMMQEIVKQYFADLKKEG